MAMHRLPGSQIITYQKHTPRFGNDCFLASGACAIGDLVTGDEVSFWFNTVVRADCNFIRIGNRVNIQDQTTVHVTNGVSPTIIEDEVSIGHSALIHGCTIQKGCLIGMGAIIMDDVVVGAQSLVAAGALLPPNKKYPPKHLIIGSPAKATRPLNHDELDQIKNTWANYIKYKQGYKEDET